MKKNIIKATLVAVFALFAGYNVHSSMKSDTLSDLALSNIEALAGGESGLGDCATYCRPETGYMCIIRYSGETEGITCDEQRKK